MNKRYTILFSAASVAFAAIIIIAVVHLNSNHGTLLYRDRGNSQAIEYQNSHDVFVSAQPDSNDNASTVSPSEVVQPEYLVNINTASAYELAALLPGIGEKKAANIVEYREVTGGFRSVDELIEVEGISENLLDRIRPYCIVEDQP